MKLIDQAVILNPSAFISKLLVSVGIMPNIIGFHYLKTAIMIVAQCGAFKSCKILYCEVAKRFGISTDKVASSIAHCIQTAGSRGFLKELNQIFDMKIVQDNYFLTNREFIWILAESLNNIYSLEQLKKFV